MRQVCLLCGLTLAGIVPLAGCSKSPADRATQARATIASWEATLRLLEAQEARGAVPEVYARQVRQAAQEARDQAAAQFDQSRAP
jgi:hypothetical protein